MKKRAFNFLHLLSHRIASKWLILAIDIFAVWLSFVMAYILRFNFDFDAIDYLQMLVNSVVAVIVTTFWFFVFKSHVSIIRHTSIHDTIRVFKAMIAGLLTLMVIGSINWPEISGVRISISMSVLLIFFINSLFALVFIRFFVKLLYINLSHFNKNEYLNVVIYGAGELGVITKNTLQSNLATRYKVIGFIDHNPGKVGKTIDGIQVFHPKELSDEFIHNRGVHELIFAIQNIDPETKNNIFKEFIHYDLSVKTVPPVANWIHGKLKVNQLETVHIEDLLQRDPIVLNNAKVKAEIKDKVVLVTGGAGSIGSELVRQLSHYNPKKIIVLDNAETPMFELRQSLLKDNSPANELFSFVVADITNQPKMEVIFNTCHPDIVFHAAAYKHVPLMEDHPDEAIRVNVFGTKTVADLAHNYHVDKFVMISTDKAVKPTNVMGASKRFAEMYCSSLNQPSLATRFVITRFGNVLGSNGSVIKIFNQQIEKGGPVTVTHPEITRFFMTIPEACQLVLEASTMSNGGDIFVFDMGKSIKITDLARNMIRLAGYTSDEIKIVFTGLRPGEKLYEELLSQKEHVIETYHPKIMIARVDNSSCSEIVISLSALQKALLKNDQFELVRVLKTAVCDYISNNSQFESLDKKTLLHN